MSNDPKKTVTKTVETEAVPDHEVQRERRRVDGEPDHVVKETTTTVEEDV